MVYLHTTRLCFQTTIASDMDSDFKKKLKEKYMKDASVTSLILVGYREKDAELEFCLRSGEGWRTACKGMAFIGKNGVGKEREGDAKTPLGDFPPLFSVYMKYEPGLFCL